MTTTILTYADIAEVVAAAVCFELGRESEEMCGGADAIAAWVLALDDNSADLERFSRAVDALGWAVVPFFEQLFSKRAA